MLDHAFRSSQVKRQSGIAHVRRQLENLAQARLHAFLSRPNGRTGSDRQETSSPSWQISVHNKPKGIFDQTQSVPFENTHS
jgi:hypothetical protein